VDVERDRANLAAVLARLMADAPGDIRYPAAYIDFLRSCLEIQTPRIRTVKRSRGDPGTGSAKSFGSLLDALGTVPPVEIGFAREMAALADSFRGMTERMESASWAGDIGAHFEMSSSFGHKGRILAAIVRFMHPSSCLELGTAYGMSASFILRAMERHVGEARDPKGWLTTVEARAQQHALASRLLASRHGERVRCELGWTRDVLPALGGKMPPVDFLFHDAGHSRRDFVHDFRAALPLLGPGAVVLFDDIDWDDPRFARSNPACHWGWMEVVRHPAVAWAVEVGPDMGLALLGEIAGR